MNGDEQRGCLFAILRLFGLDGGDDVAPSRLPYRVRDDFLSPAEAEFFRSLRAATPEGTYVCPKVRIADVLFVPKGANNVAAQNRITSKHVDFLLFDDRTRRPMLAIELDDASHDRDDRRDRDLFVDAAFAAAELPLLRIRVRKSYDRAELNQLVGDKLNGIGRSMHSPPSPPVATYRSSAPLCPKCDGPMVERVARQGSSKGEPFWGCANYPRCREVLPR